MSLSLGKQFLTYYILPSTPHVDWASHEDWGVSLLNLAQEQPRKCSNARSPRPPIGMFFLFCGNHINHYPKNGEPFRLSSVCLVSLISLLSWCVFACTMSRMHLTWHMTRVLPGLDRQVSLRLHWGSVWSGVGTKEWSGNRRNNVYLQHSFRRFGPNNDTHKHSLIIFWKIFW